MQRMEYGNSRVVTSSVLCSEITQPNKRSLESVQRRVEYKPEQLTARYTHTMLRKDISEHVAHHVPTDGQLLPCLKSSLTSLLGTTRVRTEGV